mmetsp:Transcript_29468/g.66796  ORF Transcript_29468/g.66796 Transcript_29468/m.66796 type:complete len:116 (-) Transcript_29468:4-351(-)
MIAARRSRSALLSVVALAAVALWASAPTFVPAPVQRGAAAPATLAVAASLLPAAAQASPEFAVPPEALDAGSSLNLAGLTEVLMCGMVMGIVPTTVLGLMVAAWLQFKKGPTLGI